MKKLFLLMLIALIVIIVTVGCNTLRGAGTDIKKTGEHIEHAAE